MSTNNETPETAVPAEQGTVDKTASEQIQVTDVNPAIEEFVTATAPEAAEQVPVPEKQNREDGKPEPQFDASSLIDYGPNFKVEVAKSPLGEPLKKPFDPEANAHLDLPSMAVTEYPKVVGTYRNEALAANRETAQWEASTRNAPKLYNAGAAFESSVNLADVMWRQSVKIGTEEIRSDYPKFIENGGNRLTGEEARLRIRAVLDAGSRVRIPLWHSGVWLTIKAPTEAALLELDQRIATMKIDLGKLSSGLVYASTSVYLAGALVDFVLAHTSETSFNGTLDELRNVILQPDYQQMIWGMLCAIYTDGYMYQQPCVIDPFKCRHIETARLSFTKMCFINNNALSEKQREHMRRRNPGSQSKLDVAAYQAEHQFQKNRVVRLHDRVSVELKVPTFVEYEEAGNRWIEAAMASVDNVFGKDMTDDERNSALKRHASLTVLEQYSHWVGMISFTEDEKYIEDRDTIQSVLADLTSDTEVFKNFFDGIKAYMDGIVVNIHGIPKYPCPSCQKEPTEDQLKHPQIIPIDLAETFFTLVDQRIKRMLGRRTS